VLGTLAFWQPQRLIRQGLAFGGVAGDAVGVMRLIEVAVKDAFRIESHIWPVVALAKARVANQLGGRMALE
jgi:hypothetical protein